MEVQEVKAEAVPTPEAVVEKVQEAVAEAQAKTEAPAATPQEKPVAEVKVELKERIEITAEEKLAVRELENEFLKASMEINRLQQIVQNAQRQFPALIESFTKKYAVDIKKYDFNAIELVFKRK